MLPMIGIISRATSRRGVSPSFANETSSLLMQIRPRLEDDNQNRGLKFWAPGARGAPNIAVAITNCGFWRAIANLWLTPTRRFL
jgi:hypothetical protein